MKETVILAAACVTIFATPSFSWEFSVAYEDWGDTCYLSTSGDEPGNPKLTFLMGMNRGQPLVVLLGDTGDRSGDATVEWKVGDLPTRLIKASLDDYFGEYSLNLDVGTEQQILEDLRKGGELKISFPGNPARTYDTSYVPKPLQAFLSCQE